MTGSWSPGWFIIGIVVGIPLCGLMLGFIAMIGYLILKAIDWIFLKTFRFPW